jgi:hypothetical protein
LLSYHKMHKPLALKSQALLSRAENIFRDFAQDLILEGQENGEVQNRVVQIISQQYPAILWKLSLSVLEFWIKDDSRLFEKTDTLIEKSVNTAFDLMAKTPIDSLFDLGKFVFQNRK